MKKYFFLFAIIAFFSALSTPSVAQSPFRTLYKNSISNATSSNKITPTKWDTLFAVLDSTVNSKWSVNGNTGTTAFLGKTDSTALTFKINGATGFERLKIGQNDLLYKNHNNINRFEINQSGAALRGDTASSFGYNLYLGAYKKLSPTSNGHEGIWLETYYFASKGDSLISTTGNNNNGAFIAKTRRKGSWMGYGTAPDSGYIAGASGIEVLSGHSSGASENARTGTVKGINLFNHAMSGYIDNFYSLYFQNNNFNASRVTNSYGIYQEAATWKNVLTGSTGFGTTTPAGIIDVQSTTQFAYPLPRMTTAQRNGITPQVGAMLINTDTQRAQMWSNGMWIDL